MRWFTAFTTGAVIGWVLGSTIEFFRNFDKNYHFDLEDIDD